MNFPFSFGGYGTPHKYLCNNTRRIAQEWERKTCKTCSNLFYNSCGVCDKEFGTMFIKPKHKACRYYKPKNY